MRRRELLAVLGSAIALRPPASGAQQNTMPVIGFLNSQSPQAIAGRVAGFRRGLAEEGYAEGQNVLIDYRWAEDQYERLPELAADLVGRQVQVIAANYPPVLAAKAATATIPVVFTSGADPVKIGLVASFNRPGANLTGIHLIAVGLEAKRLELLHQLVPGAAPIGVLVNPMYPNADLELHEITGAARLMTRQIEVARASTEQEVNSAFATLNQKGTAAVLVASDPFFSGRRKQLAELAARYKLPTIYNQREYAESGGLMSYGSDFADGYRLAGAYVGKILKGAKPADLPVVQPTKYELLVNLKAASALGLTIPQWLLARADEVIE